MDSKFGAKLFDTTRRYDADTDEAAEDFSGTQTRTEEEVADLLTESPNSGQNLSVIGKTLVFKGELSASEDILIQGKIQGTIKHSSTNLTVGAHGKVDADIDAKSVIVQGTVKGDINAEKSIAIEPSARVNGNLFAPVIGVKEGAKFKGTIDMEPRPQTGASTNDATSSAQAKQRQKSATKPKTENSEPEKDPSVKEGAVSAASVDAMLDA